MENLVDLCKITADREVGVIKVGKGMGGDFLSYLRLPWFTFFEGEKKVIISYIKGPKVVNTVCWPRLTRD